MPAPAVFAKNNWQATNNTKPTPQDLDDLANSILNIGVAGQAAGSIQINYNNQDLVNLRRLAMIAGNAGINMNNGPITNIGSMGVGGNIEIGAGNIILTAPGSIITAYAQGINIRYTDQWRYVNNNATGGFLGQGPNSDTIALWVAAKNVNGAMSPAALNPLFFFGADGNFGIGTQSPKKLLSLGAAHGDKLAVFEGADGSDFYGFGIAPGVLQYTAAKTTGAGAHRFYIGSAEQLQINADWGGTVSHLGPFFSVNRLVLSATFASTINDAPWYGMGLADFKLGHPDVQALQIGGWGGIRLRSASGYMDLRHDGYIQFSGAGNVIVDNELTVGKNIYITNSGGELANQFRIDGSANALYIIGNSGAGSSAGTGIWFRTAPAGGGEIDRLQISPTGDIISYGGWFVKTHPGPFDSNAAAVSAGLTAGVHYRDSNGFVRQVF